MLARLTGTGDHNKNRPDGEVSGLASMRSWRTIGPMTTITDEHLAHWRKHGYVIVENLLTPEELEAARENIARYMPTWEEYAKAPHRYRALLGSNGWPVAEFPFVGDALNHVTTHPALVEFAKKVLGTDDIMLSHSRLRGKYAGTADYDQQLHVDYNNNTLVVPKDDSEIFDVPFITYYTDVTVDLGPTQVVSQEETRDLFNRTTRFLSREEYPEFYAKEKPAVCPAGSTLIYSMRTFHRGSAMKATEGVRFSHHMSYRKASYNFTGQVTFNRVAGSPEMRHFLENATPEQRSLIGFPPVGHEYWDEDTIAAVGRRYPGMDMTPYREALRG